MTPSHTYGAYGDRLVSRSVARVAYAGEVTERDTGWYLLGNRMYSPVLRRFLNPDPRSPLDDGGFNRYGYTSGDPVNRIDPTGNAWTDWLMAGLAIGFSVLGTVFSAGALIGTVLASSFAAAAAAPGFVAMTVAASMDVVSTAASLGSIGSMVTKDQKASEVFGWMGMGAGIVSAGATIVAAKQGGFNIARVANDVKRVSTPGIATTSSASNAGGNAERVASKGVSTLGKAAATVGSVRAGLSSASPVAQSRRKSSNDSLVTSDSSANGPQLRRTLSGMSAEGSTAATLYAGPRRSARASRNPHASVEPASGSLYRSDITGPQQMGKAAGVRVETADMTKLTNDQLTRRLSEDGIGVIATGYGAMDKTTTQELNMASQVADGLLAVRAGV
jgi:RHS repeat-associated protein